ncbi:acyltransferase family protein [Synechococcus sp. CS-1327]|uniref:acyltransferase family protein n=1 Tax=Synechococcus sp. CS-1327 TaxID=2847977 RepID=UPI00223C4280|nr:acyltransferase family protein [Synechococcus sp. CS-1327]MCT0232993.1 acyltransferase [Synechococcus sp. CS-1327]
MYRPEIDGLRALAVLAVVLNHIDKSWLPSGFLGVDVFFVISGYVITGSLADHQATDLGDLLAGFYSRRLKRLLPALLVCVLLTSMAMMLVIPTGSDDSDRYWRSAVSGLLGISNLYLYRQSTDYFASATTYNPFLHTWSLGVETQFYLLFPLLVWFSGFGRPRQRRQGHGARQLSILLIVIGVPSLLAFMAWNQSDPAAAYFLLPSRLWELAAGSLLWCGSHTLKEGTTPSRTKTLGALFATLMLLSSLAFPETWRVAATLLAVGSTVAWIGLIGPGQELRRWFAHPWAVGLGVLSYSLFLWHWSVLSIARWTVGLTLGTLPWLLVLIFSLAVMSYHWVEQPFRRARWSDSRRGTIIWGLTAMVAGGFLLLGVIQPLSAWAYLGPAGSRADGLDYRTCHFDGSEGAAASRTMASGACGLTATTVGSKTTWFFLGDSHSSHLAGLATELNRRFGVAIQKVGLAWMPTPPVSFLREAPEANGRRDAGRNESLLQVQEMLAQTILARIRPGDVLVLSNRLAYYFGDAPIRQSDRDHQLTLLNPAGKEISRMEARIGWLKELESLLKAMAMKRATVVVVLPTPEFDLDVPIPLAACSREWFRPNPSPTCKATVERQTLLTASQAIRNDLKNLESRHPNLVLLDPLSVLCPPGQLNCSTLVNGRQLYRDGDHLNTEGAALLLESLPASVLPKP